MKLKIAGFSADNNHETDPQLIDLKEIMLSKAKSGGEK